MYRDGKSTDGWTAQYMPQMCLCLPSSCSPISRLDNCRADVCYGLPRSLRLHPRPVVVIVPPIHGSESAAIDCVHSGTLPSATAKVARKLPFRACSTKKGATQKPFGQSSRFVTDEYLGSFTASASDDDALCGGEGACPDMRNFYWYSRAQGL